MRLTDEVRNYKFDTPIKPEKRKTSREYEALAVLKHSFPKLFSGLHKMEAPDLQDKDGRIGVEVTWGSSPNDEKISSESVKVPQATGKNREKCLKQIRKCGGDRRGHITFLPTGTEEGDKAYLLQAFQNKLKKADKYHIDFNKIGLVIIIDVPLSIFPDFDWGNWLEPYNNDKFDFVILSHWEGVSMYDFHSKMYENKDISKKDRSDLKILSRLTTEGIIKDDDAIWDDLLND